MSKAFDKLVSELEPAKSYADVAAWTWLKWKVAMAKPKNPKMFTVKEVGLKLLAFMDELCRQFSVMLDLFRGGSVD